MSFHAEAEVHVTAVEADRTVEGAGLGAEVFRWTRPAAELARFTAYVLPGGFSYQDRVRAGVLAAKDLFPPPGVDAFESWFATVDPKGSGRRYVGVAAPGRW